MDSTVPQVALVGTSGWKELKVSLPSEIPAEWTSDVGNEPSSILTAENDSSPCRNWRFERAREKTRATVYEVSQLMKLLCKL